MKEGLRPALPLEPLVCQNDYANDQSDTQKNQKDHSQLIHTGTSLPSRKYPNGAKAKAAVRPAPTTHLSTVSGRAIGATTKAPKVI